MLYGDEGTVIIQKLEHVAAVVGKRKTWMLQDIRLFFSSYSGWAPNTWNTAPVLG